MPGSRGLYIPDTDRWPAPFRGMGIRIEDSVCVQEEHPLVLTTEAVKEVRFPIPNLLIEYANGSLGRGY